MLISQTTEPFIKDYDIKIILDEFKRVGFEAYDFSFVHYSHLGCLICEDNYIEKAKEIKKYADKIGLICNQAHAPFPYFFPEDENKTKKMMDLVVRSIEAASILGAKVIVIHPYNWFRYKENIDLLNKFLTYAKKYKIKIGVENMWCWPEGSPRCTEAACSDINDYVKTMEGLDSKYFVANVDVGHAEMFEQGFAYTLLKGVGKYVKSIHLHDNDCLYDLHRLPFTEKIPFNLIANALREIKYTGDITLEVLNNDKLPNFINKLEEQAACAKKIREMVLNGK